MNVCEDWLLDCDRGAPAIRTVLNKMVSGNKPMNPILHPLGFVMIIVDNIDKSAWLGMHIWPGGKKIETSLPVSDIHMHDWFLKSYVISGSLRNIVFSVDDNVSNANYRTYSIKKCADSNYLYPQRQVRAEEYFEKDIPSGSCYTLEPGSFHRTQPNPCKILATLVIATEATFAGGNQVLGPLAGDNLKYVRQKFPIDKAKKLIEEVLIKE